MYTTQTDIRKAFWESHPQYQSQRKARQFRQNEYCTDIRVAFVDYVDTLARDGQISEALAQRVTL